MLEFTTLLKYCVCLFLVWWEIISFSLNSVIKCQKHLHISVTVFWKENQEREGLGLCSLSFQERGAGDPSGPNLADIWLFESQKMGSSWCVQAVVLLALVSDTKLVKMRVEPFPWGVRIVICEMPVWLCFLCCTLWVIIFPLLPTTTHKRKKKEKIIPSLKVTVQK